MSRKSKSIKRTVTPDTRYNDLTITKLINAVMKHGKKSIAQRAVYDAFDLVKEKATEDGLVVFTKAMDNVKPLVEVRSRRVGGANYQVPTEVPPPRALSLGLRWLIGAVNERGEKTIVERLAMEILDASQNRGGSVKKREDTHRIAEANKAFAHFKW